jgi:DNA-binding NarL/FixJ family response regulator
MLAKWSDAKSQQCYLQGWHGGICGSAQNGSEALEKAADLRPDMILLGVSIRVSADIIRLGAYMKLRILIADDHDLVRRGVKTLIETQTGWAVCGEAVTGREAVAKAEELKPDIAILDISMPDLNGVEATRRIRKACPLTEVLVLSMHYSDQLIREIVDAGARGYIIKSDSDRDLVEALETLARHKPFFASRATEVILGNLNQGAGKKVPELMRERLTSREREVLQLIAEGKSSKEVASHLDISVKTSETHRANIMRKLEIHTVSDLVHYAIRNQIIEA